MESFTCSPFFRVPISNLPNAFLVSFSPPYSKITLQIKKPKPSLPISCKSSPNPKPAHNHRIYSPPTSPFCLLPPALFGIRDLASSGIPSRLGRCVSSPMGFDGSVRLSKGEEDAEYVQSGGIGIALMGTTSLGKVGGGISPFLATLAANPTFVSGLLAWAFAQSAKMVLNFLVERKWDFRLLFSSGGMPSSHSALCMALTTSVAFCHGAADSLFPVCLGFSLIVMYDATGVRRHAGMHAEILNKIVEDLFQGHPISQRKLKVLLGHTPSQVIAGALLGILVACICCQGFVVAV